MIYPKYPKPSLGSSFYSGHPLMRSLIAWIPLDDCGSDSTAEFGELSEFDIRSYSSVLDGEGFPKFDRYLPCNSASGSILAPSTGPYGPCLYIDNDYIQMSVAAPTTPRTVSVHFRCKITNTPVAAMSIFGWARSPTQEIPFIGISYLPSNELRVFIDGAYRITVDAPLLEWLTIGLCCRNGASWAFYIDGEIVGTYVGGSSGLVPEILSIGWALNLPKMTGYIDDIRCWSRDLTDEEFSTLHTNPYEMFFETNIPSVLSGFAFSTILNILALDGLIQRTGITKVLSVDALLYKVLSESISLDALLRIAKTGVISIDAIIQLTGKMTIELDALLRAAKSGIVDLDAILVAAGQHTMSVDIDALVQSVQSGLIDLDALLQSSGVTGITSLDALLNKFFTKSLLLDSLLYAVRSHVLTIDALIVIAGTMPINLDALLRAVKFDVISLDALIQIVGQTVRISLDALLRAARTGIITMDAVLALKICLSAQLDALLRGRLSQGIMLDAIIGKLFSAIRMPAGRSIVISSSL